METAIIDFVDWGRKWLVSFNADKTHLVSFDHSKKHSAINVKMDGPVLKFPEFVSECKYSAQFIYSFLWYIRF